MSRPDEVPALLVAWSADEPERIGHVIALRPGRRYVFGRGAEPDGEVPRALPAIQRPDGVRTLGPLESRRLSRAQLHLEGHADGTIEVHTVGRAPLLYRGRPVRAVRLSPGDTVQIQGRMVLLATVRPARLEHRGPVADFSFGGPDGDGLVGESPAMWALRDRLAFVAPRDVHVLVTGPSGVGKELVARAIHAGSARAPHPLVSRNAATLPASLVDAELFGHARGYPQAGMPERPGLIGEADRGTLFLDEIGELPEGLQAHLLRVLDEGEYQRLGESRRRRADLRLVAATNRQPGALKHDLAARLAIHVQVPDLNERRDDVPLLLLHLLRRIASEDLPIAAQLFPQGDPSAVPRVHLDLVERLVRRRWRLHVRELEQQVWQALSASGGAELRAPPEWTEAAEAVAVSLDARPAPLTREMIVAALEACDWVQNQAWKRLGLNNRYQLYRLIKEHDIEAPS